MTASTDAEAQRLTSGRAAAVFAVLALGYFLSSLMRTVTSTLAPTLTKELTLSAGELGLLAGAYFCGFAAMQLPLGSWLDRHGPRRVLAWLLSIAAGSCALFALADSFWLLLLARLLGGVGVCACMMAPLTGFRRWLSPQMQLRANSWILMSGSLGLLAATLPVQWLMEAIGWRPLFVGLAAVFLVTILVTAWQLPRWQPATRTPALSLRAAYAPIFRHRYFLRVAPLAAINYAVLLAIQTLWAGSWMMKVTGYGDRQAATGLFGINLTMLGVFWIWGAMNPRLTRAGFTVDQLMRWGMPLGLAALLGVAVAGGHAGWLALAGFCAASSFLSLTHPAVALAFPPGEAGRAVSAFNLLLFVGAFGWQWGIGAGIDALRARGLGVEAAHRVAFGALVLVSAAGYLWYALDLPRRRARAGTEQGGAVAASTMASSA